MTESYDHKIQVRVLKELFDRLPYEKYAIMGISYGGEIAIQYAVEYPEKVKKFFDIESAGLKGYPLYQRKTISPQASPMLRRRIWQRILCRSVP